MKLKDILEKGIPQKSNDFLEKYFRETKDLYKFYRLKLKEININEQRTEGGIKYRFPYNCKAIDNNVHGGCVMFVLDSVIAAGIGFSNFLKHDHILLTRELKIEIKKPIPIETYVYIKFKQTKGEGKKIWITAEIILNDEPIVTAEGFFIKVSL